MSKLTIDEIIELVEKANFHINLCLGRGNGKREFLKINTALKQIPGLLKELKYYKNGTLEKQIPKKPIYKSGGTDPYIVRGWACPHCQTKYPDICEFAFCPACGQAIDWDDTK